MKKISGAQKRERVDFGLNPDDAKTISDLIINKEKFSSLDEFIETACHEAVVLCEIGTQNIH